MLVVLTNTLKQTCITCSGQEFVHEVRVRYLMAKVQVIIEKW